MSTPISIGVTKPALLRSYSEPILNTRTQAPLINSDSVSIKTEKAKPAPNSAKASKPLYQVVIDFFQELGQKIMDFFTPTSKEAIEKTLIQSKLKTEAYLTRIEQNKQYLKAEGLSELQKEVFNEDIQKAQKKLGKYQAKIDTLGARLDKLTRNIPKATETKVAQGVKTETATEAVNSASQKSATEGFEKATQESAEGVLKELDNLFDKFQKSFPEIVDNFAAQLKKALR